MRLQGEPPMKGGERMKMVRRKPGGGHLGYIWPDLSQEKLRTPNGRLRTLGDRARAAIGRYLQDQSSCKVFLEVSPEAALILGLERVLVAERSYVGEWRNSIMTAGTLEWVLTVENWWAKVVTAP